MYVAYYVDIVNSVKCMKSKRELNKAHRPQREANWKNSYPLYKGKGHRRNNYAKHATNQVCNDVIAKKFKVSRQKAENT